MKWIILTPFFTFLVWLEVAYSQQPDSVIARPPGQTQPLVLPNDTLPPSVDPTLPTTATADSNQLKKPGFFKRLTADYPNPNKALYLALAIPGGGQMYNKRWWKLPLVYGAYTGVVIAVDYNTRNYRRFRDAYIASLNGLPHEFSGTRLNSADLKRIRDGFDKNKQLSYIGIVAVHIVQAAEAFVDCHLKTFDVSDDLGAVLKPSFGTIAYSGEPYLGIGLAVKFY